MQRLVLVLLLVLAAAAGGFYAGERYAYRDNTMLGIRLPPEPMTPPVPGAIAETLLVRDPFERVGKLAELLAVGGAQVGADAKAALDRPRRILGASEILLLVRAWARAEPRAATEWAYSKDWGELRIPMIEAAVQEWATVDPRTAAHEVYSRAMTFMADGEESTVAIDALIRGWYDSGRHAGLEGFLRGLGHSVDQQRAIAAFLGRTILYAGPDVAKAWALALPDEPIRLKRAAYAQLASELTRFDPKLGVAWAEEHGGGPFGEFLDKQVAVRWGQHEPEAALTWLSTRPAGKDRDRAVIATYRKWWMESPGGGPATQWLESIGRDDIEDWLKPAITVYAPGLAISDPEEAILWSELVPETQRNHVQMIVARRWRIKDAEAADAWLDQSSLPEDVKIKARRTRAPRPGARPADEEADPQGADAGAGGTAEEEPAA